MYFPAVLDTATRAFRTLVRLGLGMVLFALVAAAPAQSAPQPTACPSAVAISV